MERIANKMRNVSPKLNARDNNGRFTYIGKGTSRMEKTVVVKHGGCVMPSRHSVGACSGPDRWAEQKPSGADPLAREPTNVTESMSRTSWEANRTIAVAKSLTSGSLS